MITCTVGQLVAADETKALERFGARGLPPKVAYTAAKLLALVRRELKVYREVHNKLVKQYGEEIPPGSGTFQVRAAEFATFAAALTDVLDAPVEINWTPIALEDLGGDPLRADDLVALDPFLANGTPGTPALPKP
jgi:hypothetical protein